MYAIEDANRAIGRKRTGPVLDRTVTERQSSFEQRVLHAKHPALFCTDTFDALYYFPVF